MNHLLLWSLAFSFSVAAFATALTLASEGRGRRVVALALGWAPTVFYGYLTWRAIALAQTWGIEHSPWRYALILTAASVGGNVFLIRRRRAVEAWPRATSALSAAGLLLATLIVLSNLHTQAMQRMGDLRVEAGMLAYAALPAKPDPKENAAPWFDRAAGLADDADLDGWRGYEDALDGDEELDLDDPELDLLLDRLAPALDAFVDAAQLPRFQPDYLSSGFLGMPTVTVGHLNLGVSLALRARVRGLRGEADAALADLDALARASDLMLEGGTLLASMLATTLRGRMIEEAWGAYSRGQIDAREAQALFTRDRDVASAIQTSLQLEEAYGLSMLAQIAEPGFTEEWFGWSLSTPVEMVGVVFLLEPEIRTYRAVQAQLRERVRNQDADREPMETLRDRGILTRLLVPMIDRYVESAHRADARLAIYLAAAHWEGRRAEGADPPATVAELAGDDHGLLARIEGVVFTPLDDGGVRVTHADFATEDDRSGGLEVVLGGSPGR